MTEQTDNEKWIAFKDKCELRHSTHGPVDLCETRDNHGVRLYHHGNCSPRECMFDWKKGKGKK
jgi:hypothetical protein